MSEIGKTIKILREAKNIRLGDLAKKSKISVSFLSLIEAGEREPSLETIRKVSEVLKIPSDLLVLMSLGTVDMSKTGNKTAAAIDSTIRRIQEHEAELQKLLDKEELKYDQSKGSKPKSPR